MLVDRVVGSSLDVDKTLPADPSGYKYIDVSREPIDDNPNHSGASVMRVPIAELTEWAKPVRSRPAGCAPRRYTRAPSTSIAISAT